MHCILRRNLVDLYMSSQSWKEARANLIELIEAYRFLFGKEPLILGPEAIRRYIHSATRNPPVLTPCPLQRTSFPH